MAHCIILWMRTGAGLGFYPLFETLIRDTFLDKRIVGEREGGGRRVEYMWSKKDPVIDWRDIVEHAELAKREGWEVKSQEFVGSGHVDHLRVDPGKYGAIVKRVWED